jgi:NAD(P)-dependent dehydrogenase (short-subunit alcohol dehydrogenase family)
VPRLREKVALITGGDTEIEHAGGTAAAFAADVTNPDHVGALVERTIERFGGIELAPFGITVNDVCPGAADTPTQIPLHRMARPEEIAELCIFLASEAAGSITASSYVIDGAMMQKSGSL